ncbi:30S ribosomal protein S18 [Candidatus Karelsulcia muelleri]|uniref:30S ribosomal protein S18 n=1 Tax=Candidatus Karelsulcia muelleri TaxID=336810 RepID=UPI00374D649B
MKEKMDIISESMIKKNEDKKATETNNEEKKVNEEDSDSEKEENSLLEGEDSEKGIRFLTPFDVKTKPEKKYCFFLKNKIKYIDYKNPKFLIKFLNERGEILPRRITGTSKKFQKRLTKAIKRCKQIGLLPYITDRLR